MSSKTLPEMLTLEPSDHSWSVKMDCCVRPAAPAQDVH